jgi:hypothetical protein
MKRINGEGEGNIECERVWEAKMKVKKRESR